MLGLDRVSRTHAWRAVVIFRPWRLALLCLLAFLLLLAFSLLPLLAIVVLRLHVSVDHVGRDALLDRQWTNAGSPGP